MAASPADGGRHSRRQARAAAVARAPAAGVKPPTRSRPAGRTRARAASGAGARNRNKRGSVMAFVTLDSVRKARAQKNSNISIVTEDSAALQFVNLHGRELRYCHTTG